MSWYNRWGSRTKSTSSYSSGSRYNSWGSGNWGGWDSIRSKEDNSHLIIKQPEGYLTPTKSEISNKLEYGNRYTGFSSSRNNISESEVEFVKNFSHFFYHDMLGYLPEETFIEKYDKANLPNLNEEELAKYHNYKQAFDKISDIKVPFYTPLEKSIFYLEQLREMAKQQNKSMEDMMKQLGQQMQNMEIDEDNLNNKDVNEILDRMLGEYEEPEESDDDIDFDDIFGNGEDGEEGDNEGQGKGSGNGEEGDEEGEGKDNWGHDNSGLSNNKQEKGREEKAQKGNGGKKGGKSAPEKIFRSVLEHYHKSNSDKSKHDISKLEVLKKISKISEFGEQFAIEKEVVTKKAHNSRQRRSLRMTSFEQIANIEVIQKLLPSYSTKLLTQDLRVDSPVKTTENKQKIIILIDRSGSMSSGDKSKWIMAFLADRLKSVMEEEAEIFVSNFEAYNNDLHFYHAYDKESALKLMKDYSWYPSGGGTDIGGIIEYIADEINIRGKLHNLKIDLSKEKVEILVINDGQDSVNRKSLPWKTNALTLCDGINEELKRLCMNTDGKYVFVDRNGDIQQFSN